MKIDPVDPKITGLQGIYGMPISMFLPESFNFDLRNRRDYSTELHQIFTRCIEIIIAGVAVFQLFVERQCKNEGGISQLYFLPPKLIGYRSKLPWTTEKRISNLSIPPIGTRASNEISGVTKVHPIFIRCSQIIAERAK